VGEAVVSGGSVVVAVGNDSDGSALDWAAAEASVRRCRLDVVHVERVGWVADPTGFFPVADVASYRAGAEDMVERAARRVRSVAPDIDVSARVLLGSTCASLVSASRAAQLLVLGGRAARRRPGTRGLMTAAVAGRVARRAACPVAIVRSLQDGSHEGPAPRVVVGVDGTTSSGAAIDFACRAAVQRCVPLVLVHAWSPDLPADHEAVSCPADRCEAAARTVLDQALVQCRDRFPDLPVEGRLVCACPVPAMERESVGAALVVLGTRGWGRARATLFGSVSRSLAASARWPMVVVRPDRSIRGTAPAGRRRESTPEADRAPWE
jgi:nucleotide-binding universal stress UspA family protein